MTHVIHNYTSSSYIYILIIQRCLQDKYRKKATESHAPSKQMVKSALYKNWDRETDKSLYSLLPLGQHF